MIVTCPCALALATPMALTMGLKYLTQKGILVKKECTFENLAKIDEVFLDKTGTITEGELCVVSTEILNENPDNSFSWHELCLSM